LSVALVAVVVGLRLATGSLDLRTALVVLLLAPEAYWPVRRVGAEFHAAAEGTATFEAADALLAETPREVAAGTSALPRTGSLTLHGVGVTYPGRSTPALAPVDATLPARGLVAVVGSSGAGKSTLLAALLGHVPATGEIRLDGVDVDPTSETWRSRVAWVPQRPWLAPGTVRDNVLLGRRTASEAQIWLALEQVDLAEHVATLPDGLDSEVGEDGLGFSAGERARLVLARAVISDRPWVLLDEPTAHLDVVTETVIARTLVRLAETRAVVVVAHRDALVTLADLVVHVEPATQPAAATHRTPLPADPSRLPPESRRVEAEVTARPRWWRGQAAGVVLGALATAAGVALTATAGWLIVRASEQPPVLVLMVAIVGVRTFGLARPVLRYVERLVSHDAALDALAEERARVYADLVPLVPGRLGPQRRRGEVLAGVVDDVDALVDRRLRVASPLWTAVLVLSGTVALAALVLPQAGVLLGLTGAVGALLAFGVPRRVAWRAEPDFVAARGALSDRVTTALEGAADLTAWQATDRAADDVARSGARMAAAAERSTRGVAAGRALATLAAGAGVLGVVAVGHDVVGSAVSAPMLALLTLLPLALLDAVLPLADAGALEVRTAAAGRRLARLRDTAPAVTSPAEPLAPPVGVDLAAQGVSAGWGGSDVLRGIDLTLARGARVAVVGPSGSGKSTLAALLVRYLDPSAGRVELGGHDLRDLALDDVRRTALLLDEPHVFASDVAENVRLARPDATDAEVEAALRSARLGDWLDGLPAGLATPLGDGAAGLSGGERTRLGMARALLADTPVLVLDEPTAHLDTGTAQAVTADLLAPGPRSVVWITHGRAGLDAVDTVLDLGVDGTARTTAPTPVCPTPADRPAGAAVTPPAA
ncbi:MAG: thiol reductant ABC exporter subunit CydC, partial [Nocardioides sp.]